MPATKTREVAPGIHLIHLPLPMRPSIVNVALIESGGEAMLVDTGMRSVESLAALEEALAAIGCAKRRIRTIVCTHHHPDHCGASRDLVEMTGARLLMHRDEHESTRHFAPGERPDWVTEYFLACGIPMELFAHVPTPGEFWGSLYQPGEPDDFIDDGDRLQVGNVEVQVVSTPGHTRGHCVLYLPGARVMIAGDHLLPKITPHVGYFPGGAANPLGDFLASQEKIQRLDVALVLPAHGGEFSDHCQRARQIIQHHRTRLQEILDQIRFRERGPYDIARIVFDFDSDASLTKQFPATFETAAHLEYLRHSGQVQRIDRAKRIAYRAV